LLKSLSEGAQAPSQEPAEAPKTSAPSPMIARAPRGQNRVLRALMQGRAAFFLGDDINRKPEAGAAEQPPRADGQGPINAALAQHLLTVAGAPVTTGASLAHTAQVVAVRDGIAPVLDDLHDALDQDFQVGPTHQALAQLGRALCRPGEDNPIFLSVNFDDLIERAFAEIGQEIDILSYAVTSGQQCMFRHIKPDGSAVVLDRPNEYTDLGLSERPLLVKLAGTVDRMDLGIEHFVVTEDDHFSFVAGRDIRQLLPPALMTRLLRSHYLFLGHSLSHWTLRALVSRVLGTGKMQARSWAVSDGVDELEECFWRIRDVETIDSPIATYLQGLADALSHENAA
ncbi:MAG: SIR2 family protein, partial [Pseudomonadota bacterium]